MSGRRSFRRTGTGLPTLSIQALPTAFCRHSLLHHFLHKRQVARLIDVKPDLGIRRFHCRSPEAENAKSPFLDFADAKTSENQLENKLKAE